MKFIPINENLQKARKILKDFKIDETNPEFSELRDLLSKNLGYIGLFTYLRFVRKIPIERLRLLLDNILSNKKLLNKLPKQIVNYRDIEKLEDDLNSLNEWSRYNKEFVSRLKGNIKQKARDDQELKDTFTNMDTLTRVDVLSNFIPKIARYNDYNDFKEDLLSYVHNNRDIESVIKGIENLENTYIVYNKDGIVVAEVFKREDSCAIGSKSWCISNSKYNHWETYAGLDTNNKQYFLWNFNVPFTSNESMVGVTIKSDGGIKTSHLKNDSYINFEKYAQKYNVPTDIFKPLDKSDIDKIVKANGFTKQIYQKIINLGAYEEYKDKIPFEMKIVYGLEIDEDKLTDEQKNNPLYRLVYKSEGGINSGNLKSIVPFIEENGYLTPGMKEYVSKIPLLIKLKLFVDGDLESNELEVLLKTEDSIKYDFEFDRYDDINIKLSYEELADILESEEYLISNLASASDSYYGNSIYDDIDSADELKYINRYFNDDITKKMMEILYHLRPLISNEEFNDLVKYVSDSGHREEFDGFYDAIKSITSGKIDLEDTLQDYLSDLCYAAEDMRREDGNKFIESLIGNYNGSTMDITVSDLYDDLKTKENVMEIYTIDDYLESNPWDISLNSYNFEDEYASGMGYLMALSDEDIEKPNEELSKKLDNIIEEIEEDDSDVSKLIKLVSDLERVGFKKSYFKNAGRFGENNLSLLIKKGGEMPNKKVKITKSQVGSYFHKGGDEVEYELPYKRYVVILNKFIDIDNREMEYFIFNVDPLSLTSEFNNILINIRSKDKRESMRNIATMKEVDVDDFLKGKDNYDPNQLELNLEKKSIKSYDQFQQTRKTYL